MDSCSGDFYLNWNVGIIIFGIEMVFQSSFVLMNVN